MVRVLIVSVAAASLLATAASAGEIFRETSHEEDTFVIEDFCDEPGLDVEVAFVLDASVHIVPHGRDRQSYFLQHGRLSEVITNLATRRSISTASNVIEKDLRVTDNGDGTMTILVLATGNAVLSGEDGKAIARNPGQTRFEILVDDGGTPADPSDDEFLAFLGVVKGSTGRSDDFCEAAVPALS
ncbi:MAG TPA: hypothetical protein VI503_03425 [Gaiellaceae bacterium]|nr:hypothetical protein [Gaiellaceae bacterium]